MLKNNQKLNQILSDLNQRQKEAVTYQNGPLLIIAGAGTGKTTVITRRLAWLILSGRAKEEEVLTLTFTDKASREMEERVSQLMPYGYVDLWISTFHSFGERVLKDNALIMGLDYQFELLTSVKAWQFVHQHWSDFRFKYYQPSGNPNYFIHSLLKHFSRLRDEDISPKEYRKYQIKLASKAKTSADKEESKCLLELVNAYQTYETLKAKHNCLDFADLIVATKRLFKQHPSVLAKYHQQFKYILVDEFQDTNFSQYQLLKILAKPKNNLTVVADDDQAIYRFRGAADNNLLQFKRDYQRSKEITLVENYRSKQQILDLAYQFIQLNNPNRLEARLKKINKRLIAHRQSASPTKTKTIYFTGQTEEAEAQFVVQEIVNLINKKSSLNWSDFAILVRANHQAEIFVKQLANNEIPYQYISAQGLYQQPVIMDLIAWLKLLDNYHESQSLYRILGMSIFHLRSGDFSSNFDLSDLMLLLQQARKKNISLFSVLQDKKIISSLKKKSQAMIKYLLAMIERHTVMAKHKTVGQVLFQFLEDSGYRKDLAKQPVSPENEQRIFQIHNFFDLIYDFERENNQPTVNNFVQYLNNAVEAGAKGRMGNNPLLSGPNQVKVMTIHQAKGLEFPYVFLVGLVNKRFPSVKKAEVLPIPQTLIKSILPQGDVHLQEERRIFYVGITRARDGLYLTNAQYCGGKTAKKPSRFLQEINLDLVRNVLTDQDKEHLKMNFSSVPIITLKNKKTSIEKITPHTFSFSQIKAWLTCPRQYYYNFVLHVLPSSGRSSFSFGKSIHRTMQEFYNLIQQGKQPSLKDLMVLYNKNWINEWYDSLQQQKEYKQRGKLALSKLYRQEKSKFIKPLKIEAGFNCKIDKYLIKGRIDRIDCLTKQGKYPEVEIIDYKTGRFPKSKQQIDLQQLLIYSLAVRQCFHYQPVKLTYDYLIDGQKFSLTDFENKLDNFKQELPKIIQQIATDTNFIPTPNQWHCQHCDFKGICDARVK